ncbi:hypothetical protein [Streptomyces sp. V2I9]|uniref:hypothetical protein n=1 Tax=Streptomyces sp. V2I9 TaxID=3042304 RepID=UPI002783FAF9|nr:hypothetical protein [Streptomyces sp. V2I9]MDQ0986131.1 hypothetical protein [Streptomyces sp. V2I9]
MKKKRLWGLSLLLSILVLLLEAVIALIVSVAYGFTQESPNDGGGSPAILILALPVILVFATVVAALLSVVLVLPTVWLSEVLGRRSGGREVWWWVPVVAGVVSLAVVGLVVALAGGSGAGAFAVGWVLTAVALTVPALLWRSRRERVFGPVILWGVVAVILTTVLGGVGFWTGLLQEYRPPALTSADVVGRWTDGSGGTITFTPDGRFTAVDIDDDLDTYDDFSEADPKGGDDDRCSGQGTWTYEPGPGRWSQEVRVTVDSCAFDYWNVGGTETRPTLYQYTDDTDSGDLYELTKANG